jgi:hypothetical protein
MGENRFSFFFFFFSTGCSGTGGSGGAAAAAAATGADAGGARLAGPGGGGLPVKLSHELTRPCLDSSQFFANSFSMFFFSSASSSAALFRAASSDAFCSNCLRLRSRSANSFMVRLWTVCLNFAGSSSSICQDLLLPLETHFLEDLISKTYSAVWTIWWKAFGFILFSQLFPFLLHIL